MTAPHKAANENSPLKALPKSYATRWVAARKAQVVEAVQSGLISLDEALARYRLSLYEFMSWQRALQAEGLEGLKRTRDRMRDTAREARPRRQLDRRTQHA
jgi:hypothetical protein